VRLAVRQAQSVPLLADLKVCLETSLTRISGKSDLAKAIRYSLNRWEALCRFTQDGRLEMSNNAAERAIRPLTLGRRNWTFLGSDSGGERAAVFFTLIQSCKLNGVNPEAYLADLARPPWVGPTRISTSSASAAPAGANPIPTGSMTGRWTPGRRAAPPF
jgi:transposase